MRLVLGSLLASLALAAAAPAAAQTPCRDVAACASALARGDYAAAEAGLGALRRGATREPATLALARLYLETGRYAEAADLARPLARGRARVPAATVLGEAEMSRGRLDEAQRALESVVAEPSAHRARVMLGRLLLRRGQRARALAPLMALVQSYNDGAITDRDAEGLAYVAMAADMLESPHDANDAYQQSNQADRARVETQLEWARLFLSRYDTGHAEESVQQALQHNAHHPVAHALMARIKLEQSLDFVEAQRHLDEALAVSPNLVMAHVTRAGIAIRDMDLAAANRHLDRALAIDPTDLEALSVRAALRFLAEDTAGYRATIREVLRLNPEFSEVYTIIADYADWEHRYPQIVEMAREALRIDPNDALAHATLGLNLLRMGEEEPGLAALREAWRRDRFNVRVFNMLELFDHTIGPEYESVEAAPFVFRLHREERPVMERDVTTTMRRAWDDMRRRYGFTPQAPVHIEMFSDPQHFSVRTSGLPNVGVQGVCFGQVITALSPRAGPFNWAQITWHELAHVFHIQLSNNRVPRWFTEGLAEYETIIARPEWRREDDHLLFLAIRSGRVPPVRQLNHAFTHARSGEDMMLAYYASSMLVKYIAETHGFAALVRMLREWGRGRTTEQVVQTALSIDVDELDRNFRAHTEARLASRANDFAVDFGAYRDLEPRQAAAAAAPRDADAQAALAASLLVNGQTDEARQAMHRALRLNRAQPLARFVAARLAMARDDTRTARADLRLLIESGHDGYEVRLLQARNAFERRALPEGRAALEAATRIDPDRPEAWQGLYELAERTRDEALRAQALRRIVEIDQHDRTSQFELLRALAAQGDWAAVREHGQRAVYVDPLNAEARRIYAEALLHANEPRLALAEIDTALAAQPEHPGPVHLVRARALAALRRGREAREAAQAAVAADPSLAEAARAIGSP